MSFDYYFRLFNLRRRHFLCCTYLKTVSLTISHHTVLDFWSFFISAPGAGLATFVGTMVAPVGGTIANLLLQAEISQNYNLVVESKWTDTGCVKMFCRSLTPCRAAVTAADWWLRKNGTDTGLSQPMGTLAILLRTNRMLILNCQWTFIDF